MNMSQSFEQNKDVLQSVNSNIQWLINNQITPKQASVLLDIYSHPRSSARDIERRLNEKYSNVNFILKELVAQGVIDRTDRNGATYLYSVTKGGQEQISKLVN